MSDWPDPTTRYPLQDERSVVFLKAVVDNPQIEVGEYTYYHDFDDPLAFEKNVKYAFSFEGDKLVIRKFCAIASGATFLLNGGNHLTNTLSTFPFGIFGGGWSAALPDTWPSRGDTVIGNDVWIGYRATILPGVTVGDGAIIGAMSVVTADVPPYAVVAGNPARVLRRRFSDADIDRLLTLRWWDWPIAHITTHVRTIALGSVDMLARIAPS